MNLSDRMSEKALFERQMDCQKQGQNKMQDVMPDRMPAVLPDTMSWADGQIDVRQSSRYNVIRIRTIAKC